MTEKQGVRASCQDCGKGYRVPSAEKTYTCKACGGTVAVAAASPVLEEVEAEPAAAAPQRRPARGRAGKSAVRKRPASGETWDDDPAAPDRREDAKALRKAQKVISTARLFYGVFAAFAGLMTLMAVVMFAAPGVTVLGATVLLVLSATLLVFYIVAILQLPFQPAGWSIAVACLSTLSTLLDVVGALAEGSSPLVVGSVIRTVIMWSLVFPLLNVNQIIRRNPDLYGAHRIRGTHISRNERGSRAKSSARIQSSAASRAWRVSAIAAVAIYAVSGGGAFLVYSGSSSSGGTVRAADAPDFEEAADAFADAWQNSDVAAIAGLYPEDSVEKMEGVLRRSFSRKGWEDQLPAANEYEFYITGTRAKMDLATDAGNVEVHWKVLDGRWVLSGIRPPR